MEEAQLITSLVGERSIRLMSPLWRHAVTWRDRFDSPWALSYRFPTRDLL